MASVNVRPRGRGRIRNIVLVPSLLSSHATGSPGTIPFCVTRGTCQKEKHVQILFGRGAYLTESRFTHSNSSPYFVLFFW